MTIRVKIQSSGIPGVQPQAVQLMHGELAINYADGKLFYRTVNNEIKTISSSSDQSFKTINGELVTGEGNIVLPKQSDLDAKADKDHSQSADTITETSTRKFLIPQVSDQITANTNSIDSHSSRIADLETKIDQPVESDGKVKMEESTDAEYLSAHLDGTTLMPLSGKLTAVSLYELEASVAELNYLKGVTGNVQAQLNALTSVGNFTTSVDTHAELTALVDPNTNDMVIVLTDETKDNASSIYIFNGVQWEFAGAFTAGQLRDFIANPIKLDQEVVGILPRAHVAVQPAEQTPIIDSDNLFNATNVEAALKELFTFANDIKTRYANIIGNPVSASDSVSEVLTKVEALKIDLAAAIFNKGISAHGSNTLNELIGKVNQISRVSLEGSLKRIPFTDKTVNSTIAVNLDGDISVSDLCAQLLSYTPGATNVKTFEKQFTDLTSYTAEGIFETVGGKAQQKVTFEYQGVSAGGSMYDIAVDRAVSKIYL